MIRILIGSPIRQTKEILIAFLESLTRLNLEQIELSYCFVDDNTDKESSSLLEEFSLTNKNVTILDGSKDMLYICDNYTHRWTDELIKKITTFKNKIIDIAKEDDYDYLFFIDSDLVLHPKTLQRLISIDKEIVANIFWTQWNPQIEALPQVWLKDAYTLYPADGNKPITEGEITEQTREFIEMLKKPGTYEVGGLGACTLISKSALNKGINFNPVYNISFWGEDRHFCIRAAVLGIQLYVDTYYPAYHIYRDSDLAGVPEYINTSINKRDTEILGQKILNQVVEALQKLGDYSYKTDLNNEWKKFFTKEEALRQEAILKNSRFEVIRNKIIHKIQPMECQMSFYNDNTTIVCKTKLNENGYKNSYSIYEEFDATLTIRKQPNEEWLIEEFKIDNRRVLDFIPLIRKAKEIDNKLTLSMIVKNEASRYLPKVLEKAREFIDEAVIIDDGSTDNTVEVCREILKGIPLTIVQNKKSIFENEGQLRMQQWYETIATNPDWILFLDADEMFEDRFKDNVRSLMNNIDFDLYYFRLYDFWDGENYRNDKLWCAHNTYRPFMLRYQKNFKYKFNENPQHCGRMPENVTQTPGARSDLRLKHYGWSTPEDRIEKYARYMLLDPNGTYGSIDQYKSILDNNPILARWNENDWR